MKHAVWLGGQAVEFRKGQKVVYPYHGVVEVTDRVTQVIDGKKVKVVVFSVPHRKATEHTAMTVSIPEERAESIGIRPAASPEDADDVLEVLRVTDARVPSNWSRRFKNHQEKLKSGDLFQCAEVVRNLTNRKRTSNLASAETAMHATARYLLASELAVTWNVNAEEAEARMDRALNNTEEADVAKAAK